MGAQGVVAGFKVVAAVNLCRGWVRADRRCVALGVGLQPRCQALGIGRSQAGLLQCVMKSAEPLRIECQVVVQFCRLPRGPGADGGVLGLFHHHDEGGQRRQL